MQKVAISHLELISIIHLLEEEDLFEEQFQFFFFSRAIVTSECLLFHCDTRVATSLTVSVSRQF